MNAWWLACLSATAANLAVSGIGRPKTDVTSTGGSVVVSVGPAGGWSFVVADLISSALLIAAGGLLATTIINVGRWQQESAAHGPARAVRARSE